MVRFTPDLNHSIHIKGLSVQFSFGSMGMGCMISMSRSSFLRGRNQAPTIHMKVSLGVGICESPEVSNKQLRRVVEFIWNVLCFSRLIRVFVNLAEEPNA